MSEKCVLLHVILKNSNNGFERFFNSHDCTTFRSFEFSRILEVVKSNSPVRFFRTPIVSGKYPVAETKQLLNKMRNSAILLTTRHGRVTKGQGARDFFIRCVFVEWRSASMGRRGKKRRGKTGSRGIQEFPPLWVQGKRGGPSRQRRQPLERDRQTELKAGTREKWPTLFCEERWIIQCRRALLDAPMYSPMYSPVCTRTCEVCQEWNCLLVGETLRSSVHQ